MADTVQLMPCNGVWGIPLEVHVDGVTIKYCATQFREIAVSTTPKDQLGEQYEATVRDMITKENELTNQRMLWMAAFNGLLFAALGFAWDKVGAKFLAIVFSLLGVSASFLNGLALIYASHAQRRLLFWWYSKKPKTYIGPGVMGCEPLDKKRYSLYITPWILIAFIFTAGWLAILVYVFKKVI